MALRRTLLKRLFNRNRDPPPITAIEHSPFSSPSSVPPNVAKANFHRELITSPDSAERGFFRRVLQRKGINQATSVPVGDRLREKLRSVNFLGDRPRLDGLTPPVTNPVSEDSLCGISVQDARKILRSVQIEMVRSRLKQIPANSIPYSEYIQICVNACSNRDQGTEFAKMLDESGNVIVLGNVVFLQTDQVVKSMEKIISQSIAIPNDPRRKELEELEKEKAVIDRKAESLVKGELYCGLGFLVLQTLGFMRLTFWEFSWDVMEPICFFVASLHFALSYGFFLRTSKEPSFEGYFQRRFKAKQNKLMKIHKFDVKKHDELCKAFYPNYGKPAGNFAESCHSAGGTIFGTIDR